MSSLKTKCWWLFGFIWLLQGCDGSDWNVNQIFVSDAQKETLVALIEEAQIAYNAGDFKDALRLATKAEKLSPENEEIAVLLGYVNLALAGMDSFRIAKGLISASSDDDDDDSDDSSGSLNLASSNRATKFFNKLKAILDVDDSVLQQLGELNSEDDLEGFAGLDVILPVSALEARELTDIPVVRYINQAIEKICPFVDEEVKLPDSDARHSTDQCVATETTRERQVISHFLWAFVHIAEATLFYSVVQYTEEGAEKANIELRADALQEEEFSLSSYAAHTVSLADTMTQVYAVDDPDSQFTAIVTDIGVAALAFAVIGQMPRKVEKALERAVSSLQDLDDVTGSTAAEQQGNTLKNQLNGALADSLEEEINSVAASDPEEFEESQEDLCSAYETISGTDDLPSACG